MKAQLRKSYTSVGRVYFWTATIHKWHNLLEADSVKDIITGSLKFLSDKKLVTVFAFVIMPTHIHLIWQLNAPNGKESAKAGFMKFTAHAFKRYLKLNGGLDKYKVNAADKAFEFWQRDSMAIEIHNEQMAKQKLDYIHLNPIAGKWKLANDDISYYYSSARFYESGINDFGFLKNLFTYKAGE